MPSFIGLLKEFRILLPMTVEEYQIGQLYSVAEASKEVTGGGDGVEVVVNEPYKRKVTNSNGEEVEECGQLTNKIYHLEKKVPGFIRTIAPTGSLTVEEQAHNAYPYCCTIITFCLAPLQVHNLNDEELNAREVVYIDIVNDAIKSQDYKESEDPSKFHSEKTGRGPLQPNWKIQQQEKRLFTLFHRQVFCWLDKYHGMTMADIRALEDKTKDDLQKERTTGELRGFSADKEK
eukprot:XP_011663302.1 PREDICTED: phosphatidylinositol transfer protein alpha isoform [Strongylocentrotus purpuratus]